MYGSAPESVAAVQFWAESVRREHHGWKFNSYPALFRSLDRVQQAAQAMDGIGVIRAARRARQLFLQDEYAYWPRLEARWLQSTHFCLVFNPAWYFISQVAYLADVYIVVHVWTQALWHCEVAWSALAVETGTFPNFDALFEQEGMHWQPVRTKGGECHPSLAWPTAVIPYDAPTSAFLT